MLKVVCIWESQKTQDPVILTVKKNGSKILIFSVKNIMIHYWKQITELLCVLPWKESKT